MAAIARHEGRCYDTWSSYGFSPEVMEYGKNPHFAGTRDASSDESCSKARPFTLPTSWPIRNTVRRMRRNCATCEPCSGAAAARGNPIGVICCRGRIGAAVHRQADRAGRHFADQAVIAIENVRLFDEVQARTSDLARSVEELRALGEVSQAVNSTLELQTVFDTIVANPAPAFRDRSWRDLRARRAADGNSSCARPTA